MIFNIILVPGICNQDFGSPLKTLKNILPSEVTLHVRESGGGWGVSLQSQIVPKLSNTLMVKYQTARKKHTCKSCYFVMMYFLNKTTHD